MRYSFPEMGKYSKRDGNMTVMSAILDVQWSASPSLTPPLLQHPILEFLALSNSGSDFFNVILYIFMNTENSERFKL